MACQVRRFSVTKPVSLDDVEAANPLRADYNDNNPAPSCSKHLPPSEFLSPPSYDDDKDYDFEERLLSEKGEKEIVRNSNASGQSDDTVSCLAEPDAYVPLTVVGEIDGEAKAAAEIGRQFAGRKVRRLVYKDGTCNIAHSRVTQRRFRFLVDIFTTVVDMRWRYNVLMFAAAFLVSWTFFGVIWFIIAAAHGDLYHKDDEEWTSCVAHVYDFQTALLFSIETQHTIGYGYRYIEPKCPDAFIILMLQSCLGVFIQALMAGIIFAKLSLPKRRAHTILFSKKAVISKRDNEYCLLFRVGDMRKSHFVSTSIRALLIRDRKTSEGETIPLSQYALDIQTETSLTDQNDNFMFLVWPVTAVHRINHLSPLWELSAESLLKERFELIIILEGVVEATGATTQIRTSYLPSEILWAHRPASLLAYQKENGVYRIDYSQFHAVVPVAMPEISAKQFSESLRRESFTRQLSSDGYKTSATLPPGRLYGSGRSTRWKALRAVKTTIALRRIASGRRSLRANSDNDEKKAENSEHLENHFLSI